MSLQHPPLIDNVANKHASILHPMYQNLYIDDLIVPYGSLTLSEILVQPPRYCEMMSVSQSLYKFSLIVIKITELLVLLEKNIGDYP